jgi:hypothetical protein
VLVEVLHIVMCRPAPAFQVLRCRNQSTALTALTRTPLLRCRSFVWDALSYDLGDALAPRRLPLVFSYDTPFSFAADRSAKENISPMGGSNPQPSDETPLLDRPC